MPMIRDLIKTIVGAPPQNQQGQNQQGQNQQVQNQYQSQGQWSQNQNFNQYQNNGRGSSRVGKIRARRQDRKASRRSAVTGGFASMMGSSSNTQQPQQYYNSSYRGVQNQEFLDDHRSYADRSGSVQYPGQQVRYSSDGCDFNLSQNSSSVQQPGVSTYQNSQPQVIRQRRNPFDDVVPPYGSEETRRPESMESVYVDEMKR